MRTIPEEIALAIDQVDHEFGFREIHRIWYGSGNCVAIVEDNDGKKFRILVEEI